jgi:hypothetical protein
MGPSSDSVVQTIRSEGRILVIVASVEGQHCGWHEAIFYDGVGHADRPPSRHALERLWAFPTPGIPHSNINTRFDPLEATHQNDHDQIPLWADPAVDFWKTMSYDGPWHEDLQPIDLARRAWGYQAWTNRHIAAGIVQTFIQRLVMDKAPAALTSDGHLIAVSAESQRYNSIVDRHTSIGEWLSALGGPDPNAQRAHQCALAILHNHQAAFAVLSEVFNVLSDTGIEDLPIACKTSFEAALLDSQVTSEGTLRPWLKNVGFSRIELQRMPIDLSALEDDVARLWRNGMELIDVIDAGLYFKPSDFPVPFDTVNRALERVVLEGTVDHAESRVTELLNEAQIARQWSIPWGARVAINFGPFVALRIFELSGEFACHFLDDQDRYFTVAIGIGKGVPRAITHQLVRRQQDDGELTWNDDAQASLKLIAAAIVRDFLVVEERESLFSSRNMRKRVRGRDVRSIIYLPRVRYAAPEIDRLRSENAAAAVRTRHSVGHHLRRSKESSPAQQFLAQRYGIHVPEGFTFVRPHERGSGAADTRMRVYRSRSASRMLFEELDSAPSGSRPAWFDFEKDCARLLRARGMEVIHQAAQRDGDGGVDLYAVDAAGQSWVVQCKCWAAHREVPPAVVRELAGAINLADKGSAKSSRGMIITTSTFGPGAVTAAAALDFELIDGAGLERRMDY